MAINRKYLEDVKMNVMASLGNLSSSMAFASKPQPTGFPTQVAQLDPNDVKIMGAQAAAEYERADPHAEQRTIPQGLQPNMTPASQGKTIDYEQAQALTRQRNAQIEQMKAGFTKPGQTTGTRKVITDEEREALEAARRAQSLKVLGYM